MSVDTYLEGKKTSGYRREHIDDVTVLLAPKLIRHASRVQLVTKKRIIGSKLVALAHHQHSAACRH